MHKIIEKAKKFATKAHAGQVRKFSGRPYIEHPWRVAENVPMLPDFAIAAAWLHDVLEDTDNTADTLLAAGFLAATVNIVIDLTRDPGESYADYILRLHNNYNHNVLRIKLADLRDNLSDLQPGALRDKYELASLILSGRFDPAR